MTTTAKHGLNSSGIVKSLETPDGGDIHVVGYHKGYEFMVCDSDGRTRKFSDNFYGNPTRAIYEALKWYYDNE